MRPLLHTKALTTTHLQPLGSACRYRSTKPSRRPLKNPRVSHDLGLLSFNKRPNARPRSIFNMTPEELVPPAGYKPRDPMEATLRKVGIMRRAPPAPEDDPQNRKYPYSTSVVVPPLPTAIIDGELPILQQQRDLLRFSGSTSRFYPLFDKRDPDHIPMGSVLLVESWTDATKTTSTSFGGVLINQRKAADDITFLIRNIVASTPVEIRYNLGSPLIRDIKILQTPPPQYSHLATRTNLYDLRWQPNVLSKLVGKNLTVGMTSALQQAETKRKEYIVKVRQAAAEVARAAGSE